MTRKFNFGEIWLADLNPKVGTELGKLRPVLIIQNQILLEINHPSTLIIPLTTKLIEDVAVSDGMLTLEQDGAIQALKGNTTYEEIYRVIG